MMTKLVCSDCQHENEPERIYCHNCGARLDRSSTLKERSESEEPADETKKRLERMFDPRRGRTRALALRLTKTIAGAFCLALVILMFLPAGFPLEEKNYDFAPMINMDMVSAASSRQTAPLTYTDAQANSYIASVLRRKDSPAHTGFFPLKRTLVEFGEGVCAVRVERQIFGFSVFAGNTYRVSLQDGKLVAEPVASFIGRLPIHPALAKASELLFLKAWDSLAREKNSVAKMAAIEFHDHSVAIFAAR